MSPRGGPASPHLEWRVRLFMGGGVLGLVGIATERSWLIWVALAVLGVGFALRFSADEHEGEVDESPAAPERGDGPHTPSD